jgi:putative ABC transport system permease protein
MYPNLLGPLLIASCLLITSVAVIAFSQPVSRRLAERQFSRRRSEVLLAVVGSVLGTAIIAGSLIVGDTLNFSVRQEAYRTLGPIDERVVSSTADFGREVAARLQALRRRPDVDGVFSAAVSPAAAGTAAAGEPRVLAWDMDLTAAGRFGRAGGRSGLSGPTPGPGHMVVNQPLASALDVGAGSRATLYLFGRPYSLRIDRVVAQRGLAGSGLGATVNRNAFLPTGLLAEAAAAAHTQPTWVTFVSNAGGVQGGTRHTAAVKQAIRAHLGALANSVLVQTPKKDVLDAAKVTGDTLGAVFLMIGSFSIIAGALLLVNMFVMLAEERTGQLGVLRAIGMRRRALVGTFSLEGAAYVMLALVPGLLLGIAVGWAVAHVAGRIFQSFSATGEGLSIAFAVTPVSLINAAALGLIIGLVTIGVTSIRISRLNVIAAIRDLPRSRSPKRRRTRLIVATSAAILCALISIPVVAASQPEGTYLLPALAATCAIPIMTRLLNPRLAVNVAAGFALTWSLLLPVLRPRLFDHASMAVFVIIGCQLAVFGVALISTNQQLILRPLRGLIKATSTAGLALRLAIAYPMAKRFRTGATLVMYTLITLVVVLLIEIAGLIDKSIDRNIADASAGYSMRVDVNPASARQTIAELTGGGFPQISSLAPLTIADALSTDPGGRTNAVLSATVVGVPDNAMSRMPFDKRLRGMNSDAAVWRLLARDPRYVVLDTNFGSTGGPQGNYYAPGDKMEVIDPRTRLSQYKTIAGILSNALVFYPTLGQSASFPVVMSANAAKGFAGQAAQVSAALVKTRPGTDLTRLSKQLQRRYLAAGLVASPTAAAVRRVFAANIAFFKLMEGFLALGLAVGMTGLGVVMIRAVRERRRTIGVLRALGFQARTVQSAFLMESALIAVQGVILGCVLGGVTTWLMYGNSAAFQGIRGGYPIEWIPITTLAAGTILISILITTFPARRAARVQPAIAVRVSD